MLTEKMGWGLLEFVDWFVETSVNIFEFVNSSVSAPAPTSKYHPFVNTNDVVLVTFVENSLNLRNIGIANLTPAFDDPDWPVGITSKVSVFDFNQHDIHIPSAIQHLELLRSGEIDGMWLLGVPGISYLNFISPVPCIGTGLQWEHKDIDRLIHHLKSL